MRAARRLVEGTDDVVSDVPPPGLGGGDARETMVRGRAVECERRHRRVHISRGVLHARAGGGAGAEGGVVVVVVVVVQGEGGRRGADRGEPRRSNWKYYYTRRACGISACGELRGGGGSGMEGGNGAALDSAEPESSTATEREREKERKRERERETIRIVDRDR